MTDRSYNEPTAAPATSCYVLFENHTQGLALHAACSKEGVPARISPAPREANASCGMSLLVDCADVDEVKRVASDAHLEIQRVLELENQIDPDRHTFC